MLFSGSEPNLVYPVGNKVTLTESFLNILKTIQKTFPVFVALTSTYCFNFFQIL